MSRHWIYIFAISSTCCMNLGDCLDSNIDFLFDPQNTDDDSESPNRISGSSCQWVAAPENGENYRLCSRGGCPSKAGSHWSNGTVRFTRCNKHFLLAKGYDRDTCIDGQWSSTDHQCVQCGKSPNSFDNLLMAPLIHFGFNSSRGDFPWMAALYTPLDEGQWTQICGGTLVSPTLVLTAAHCFYPSGIKLTPENLKIGIGKLLVDYYSDELGADIHAVKKIVHPERYLGIAHLYDLDIGLVVLARSVAISSRVMPACIDWRRASTPSNNQVGVLAGWGLTESNAKSSTLKWAFQKFASYEKCKELMTTLDLKLFTHDKFCALDVEGGKADRGDSGGGLTFVRENTHFVYGIVSTKLIGEDKKMRLFTNVMNDGHLTWLVRQWRLLQGHQGLGGGCENSEECEENRVCMSRACVDPCRDACSEDSFCQVKRHLSSCLNFDKVQRLVTNPQGKFNYDYTYFPAPRNSFIRFKVKTNYEAVILLTEHSYDTKLAKHKIIISGGNGRKSVIRNPVWLFYGDEKTEVQTPGILSPDEFRGFWVKYSDGTTAIGRENEEEPFISWNKTNKPNVKYFGVTSYGSKAEWMILGAGCQHNDDCEEDRACAVETEACVDPCKGVCDSYFCNAMLHKSSCFKLPGATKLITNPLILPELEYKEFYPAPSNSIIRFKVKTKNDATIILSGTKDQDALPYYEIILGPILSGVRTVRFQSGDIFQTPDNLHQHEFRGFWIKFQRGKLEVGKEDEVKPFVSWTDPLPSFEIKYYSFTTYETYGEWAVYNS